MILLPIAVVVLLLVSALLAASETALFALMRMDHTRTNLNAAVQHALDRLMARRVKLKFYEAGMDLGWSTNPVESFRLFQGKVLDEYDRIVDEFGLDVVNAVGSITEQQRLVRNLIAKHVATTHVAEGAERKAEITDEQPA